MPGPGSLREERSTPQHADGLRRIRPRPLHQAADKQHRRGPSIPLAGALESRSVKSSQRFLSARIWKVHRLSIQSVARKPSSIDSVFEVAFSDERQRCDVKLLPKCNSRLLFSPNVPVLPANVQVAKDIVCDAQMRSRSNSAALVPYHLSLVSGFLTRTVP